LGFYISKSSKHGGSSFIMPHTPQHKIKRKEERETISRQGKTALEERGTKFKPEERTKGQLDVEKGQKQVDFFKNQLAKGKFDDPIEESQLKEAIKRSEKDFEIDLARREIEKQQPEEQKLTPVEQFDEDVKKGLILGAKIGLPLAGLIVTGGLLGIAPAAARIGQTAVISTRVTGHRLVRQSLFGSGGKLLGKESIKGLGVKRATRNFIGKPAISKVDKIFQTRGFKNLKIVKRFANNQKSQAVTKSFLLKAGIGIGAVTVLIKAIETYPFAGFLKEEATQITGFGFNQAERNDDLVGMAEAIRITEDILNSEDEIKSKVPYVNVLNELDGYFEAVAVKLDTDKRTFEKKSQELAERG